MKQHFWFFIAGVLVIGCARPSEPSAQRCVRGLCYQVKGGLAVAEGDMVLGSSEELDAVGRSDVRAGIVLPYATSRWPKGRVPYVIDPKLPNPQRVLDSLKVFHARTNVRFVPRVNEVAYIVFRPWTKGWCQSWLGRTGKAQAVDLDASCDPRWIIHELGHALGMWHEQSREDRDRHVKIVWANVTPGMESNFAKRITDGNDVGAYDFASTMHYPPWTFSKNGNPTITRLDGGLDGFGNTNGLSDGDIYTINRMYPAIR
jgi:hypothetical protein